MRKIAGFLKRYYLKRTKKCRVRSTYVDLNAIKGDKIEIMDGTHIDKFTSIDSYTYIGYNCFITKAVIGRYVSIANNVSIGLGEHKIQNISTSSLFYDDPYNTLTEKECIIGNDCWIGVDCIIRRGVKIGNGAIIGANSFVNHDVPDFAIVGGTPARIIGYRFEPDQIALINESKWWEGNLAEAKKAIENISIQLALTNQENS